MVEVTRENFEEAFNELQYEVQNSSFISIDCEFSSLPSNTNVGNSFFDSGDDRFTDVRKNIGTAIVLQVGITPFKYSRDLNHYTANPYKFYVFPRFFGPVNVSFFCRSEAIQFLCDHKFDFNKGFYKGISYLNRTNKESILKGLYDGKLLSCLEENLNHDEAREILSICELVNKWKVAYSDSLSVDVPINRDNHPFNYLLQERIRLFNKEVWTENKGDKMIVTKVTKEKRLMLDEMEKEPKYKEKFIDSLLGFSRVYDMLAASKKPLVGHNVYFDLLMMYHQFYEHLPASYSKFKTTINEQFPFIYDTKFLSYELHRLKKQKKIPDNSLGSLYEKYQDTNTLFHAPKVVLASNCIYLSAAEQKKHDAGWDSYMTGFIFLKLANQFLQERKKSECSNLTFTELLSCVKQWANKINLARAKISYVNLEGKDPPSTRPPLLHVQKPGKQIITKLELDDMFKKYEPVNKKLLTGHSALIAVSNYASFKSILSDFDNSGLLKVEKYSLVRHNSSIRACCLVVIIVPLVFAAWTSFKSD